MKNSFRVSNLPIAFKIQGIAIVVLMLMALVAAYSIQLISRISDDLDLVANGFLPLSETVTRINVSVLEKGVLLQRQFVMLGDEALEEELEKDRAHFQTLAEEVISEFEEARLLLRNLVSSRGNFAEDINEIDQGLLAIESHYLAFAEQGKAVLAVRETGDIERFDAILPLLNESQDQFEQEIASLRYRIEILAEDAVVQADRDEKSLLRMNTSLTLIAAILGLGFAIIVTQLLVRALRNLVEGAEAVERGELDTEVAVTSQDEIGKLTGAFNQMVDELRLKERIKDTFGRYMDPRIVNDLLSHPEFTEPGGERREMTVMFIDLKGFTSISEALDPDDLVNMINRFFTHMSDAIVENKGVVDKFMGDAVMAYWGEPFCNPDEHAHLACQAANRALQLLDVFRQELQQERDAMKELDIDLRVGISTGEIIVGTVGSRVSKSYTVMGDSVNLGSRLEGVNKTYGTHVIISERTANLVSNDFALREIDQIRVKGKTQPARIFELLLEPLPAEAEKYFSQALQAYRTQHWQMAAQALHSCLQITPDDPVTSIYLQRLERLEHSDIQPEWDGVWVFENK